jgi:predicted nucleic acid-binding protein
MRTYWDSSALIAALHDPELRSRIRRGENGTRPHSPTEVFSTLTKGVSFRYPPADAAKMAADLAADLDFVELSADDTVSALKKASSLGVRGARIHDLMHAMAAIKYRADELLTLDDSGFASLNLSLQITAP